MREAAGPAWGAARPIAQICWRVDMAFEFLIVFDGRLAKAGKVRVNPVGCVLLAETPGPKQAGIRSALLPE